MGRIGVRSETGLLYVNANDIAWTSSLRENDGGRSARQLYLTNCAGCHRDDMHGTPPAIPSLADLRGKKHADASRPRFSKVQGECLRFRVWAPVMSLPSPITF